MEGAHFLNFDGFARVSMSKLQPYIPQSGAPLAHFFLKTADNRGHRRSSTMPFKG